MAKEERVNAERDREEESPLGGDHARLASLLGSSSPPKANAGEGPGRQSSKQVGLVSANIKSRCDCFCRAPRVQVIEINPQQGPGVESYGSSRLGNHLD